MSTRNDLIFFSLVFLVTVVMSLLGIGVGRKISPTSQVAWSVGLIVSLLIGVAALFGIYKWGKVCGSNDGFHFEVTPAKRCSLGPYMTQSGPNHELCKKMWSTPEGRDQIAYYTCLNGQCFSPSQGDTTGKPMGAGLYSGMPIHMPMTPMSDSMWQNKMCNPPIVQKGHPIVL